MSLETYEKNARRSRFVIFVVPGDEVENKVEESLKHFGKKKFRIFLLKSYGDLMEPIKYVSAFTMQIVSHFYYFKYYFKMFL